MSPWDRKYSDDQREAVVSAYLDRQIRPASRVCELAAAGELTLRGNRLDAFTIGVNMVRDYARHHRRRRQGKVQSQLADVPHRDAIEAMRRRLVNLVDAELEQLEAREKRKPGTVQPDQIRQISRALLELARLPGPTEKRVKSPDIKDPETGQVSSGQGTAIAGPLLRAHRTQGLARADRARTALPSPPSHPDTSSNTDQAV